MAIWLAVLGIDFAILWGVLAFAVNYIPNIGSILAGVPVVLLSWLQHGVVIAALVAAGYLVINTVFGNLLEPRVMGRGLGLSPLVILLSLLFWGFLLGSEGVLLAVPLTMTLKIGLEASEATRRYAALLGETDVPAHASPAG